MNDMIGLAYVLVGIMYTAVMAWVNRTMVFKVLRESKVREDEKPWLLFVALLLTVSIWPVAVVMDAHELMKRRRE